jgi:hypothetical protein
VRGEREPVVLPGDQIDVVLPEDRVPGIAVVGGDLPAQLTLDNRDRRAGRGPPRVDDPVVERAVDQLFRAWLRVCREGGQAAEKGGDGHEAQRDAAVRPGVQRMPPERLAGGLADMRWP